MIKGMHILGYKDYDVTVNRTTVFRSHFAVERVFTDYREKRVSPERYVSNPITNALCSAACDKPK